MPSPVPLILFYKTRNSGCLGTKAFVKSPGGKKKKKSKCSKKAATSIVLFYLRQQQQQNFFYPWRSLLDSEVQKFHEKEPSRENVQFLFFHVEEISQVCFSLFVSPIKQLHLFCLNLERLHCISFSIVFCLLAKL